MRKLDGTVALSTEMGASVFIKKWTLKGLIATGHIQRQETAGFQP
jgi:hypothetical protein